MGAWGTYLGNGGYYLGNGVPMGRGIYSHGVYFGLTLGIWVGASTMVKGVCTLILRKYF